MPPREVWKPIPISQSKYDVSSLGRIRNATTKRVRVQTYNSQNGRPQVCLSLRTGPKVFWVAPLVAEAFLGPRPPSWDIDHIDDDFTNNKATNLQYLTRSENTKKSYRNRKAVTGPQLSRASHETIQRLWASGKYSKRHISKLLAINQATVTRSLSGKITRYGKKEVRVTTADVAPKLGVRKYIQIGGETRCLAEWLRIYAISAKGYRLRLKHGMSEVEAITSPKRSKGGK